MRITSLQPQATNPDRINVFVDDQFLLGVSTLVVVNLGLKIGQELTNDQITQLQQEEARQQAVERALNYLSFRPRSREEVRRYLKRKETPPEIIDAVLVRLDALELINDQSFTEFWIDARERSSPKGAQAIKHELRQKGVKREVIDEMVTDEQDEELALRAAEKKAISLIRQPDIDYKTFYNRLGSFLQRRGFSYEIVKKVVKALWEELKQEPTEEE
ncbi:RecX family transcriptional regulator [Tengunoibacter tsumagoiensis]|uniref:Regulatory protein RecX n=1 Tax=Tengunoibacter tsumagoiensis TaxID=2014871 RepID=A0A401ZV17_9CHLR|nr:RecX family transcriptional regulator [Tengunoibacter tsumagoiensis]GCE10788.1 regulatory protein RecX [Tengunoibacter tsumagoiensis]